MQIAVVGVKVVETVAAPAYFANAQPLKVPAGESNAIDVKVVDSAGNAVDLTGGQLLLTVKASPASANPLVSRQATIASPATAGHASFPLVPADTLSLLGVYVWDVWFTDASNNRYQIVPSSTFQVLAGLGQPGQPVTVPATQTPLALGPQGPAGAPGAPGDATNATYAPTVPGNWPTSPATIKAALDALGENFRSHVFATNFPGADLGAKINAANAFLGATKGTIEVPPGDYTISTPVVLSDYRKLKLGAGYYTNNTTTAAFALGNSCELCGDGDATVIEHTNYVTAGPKVSDGIVGLYFHDFKSVARAGVPPDGLWTQYAVIGTVNAHNVWIERIHFKDSNMMPWSLGGDSSGGKKSQNIWITDCLHEDIKAYVAAVNAENFHIVRNTFLRPPTMGTMDFEPNLPTDSIANWEIVGNIFDFRGASNCSGPDIQWAQTGPGVIADNIFYADAFPALSALCGIVLNGTHDVTVSNNRTYGYFQQVPFDFVNAVRAKVRGNVAYGEWAYGPFIFDGCTYCDVEDNAIFGDYGTLGIAEANAADHNTFKNNRVTAINGYNATPAVTLVGANSRKWNNLLNGVLEPGSASSLANVQPQGTLYFGGGVGPADGADVNTILKYQTAEASGPAFYEWFADYANAAGDGHKDQGYAFGWNENATGIVNPARGAFGFHIENDYQPTIGERQIEFYFTAYNPADSTVYRPFGITVDLLHPGAPQVGASGTSFSLQHVAGGAQLWTWSLGDGSGTAQINTPTNNTAIIVANNQVQFALLKAASPLGYIGLAVLDSTNRLNIGDYGVPIVFKEDLWFYDSGRGAVYDDGGTNAIWGFSGLLNLGHTGAPINSGYAYKWTAYRKNGQNYGVSDSPGLDLFNAQPAVNGAPQYAPAIHMQGAAWNSTSGGAEWTEWTVQAQQVQQTAGSPRGDIVFSYASPAGGTKAEMARLYGDGTFGAKALKTKTHAGYAGSDNVVQTAAVQTTNATTTTIATLPLSASTTYRIKAECVARDAAGVEHASLGRVACVYREAGAAVQQGSTQPAWGDIHSSPGMDLTIVPSGNNALVQVTGVAATTINWAVTLTYQAVSTT